MGAVQLSSRPDSLRHHAIKAVVEGGSTGIHIQKWTARQRESGQRDPSGGIQTGCVIDAVIAADRSGNG